jgi:hypothetical protein
MEAAPSLRRFGFLQQRWFVLGLTLFFLVLSIHYADKVLNSERDNRSAFLRWRTQVQDMDEGVDIWQKYVYPNPPIMVLLLQPFFALPAWLGSMAWFYAKVLMALASIFLAFRLVETPDRPWPEWAKAVVVVLAMRPITGDLTHGNVNLFILLLCVGALICFRHRRDWSAGLLLALAIACKVTPALFVPYFLWKRSWKVLAGCAAGLVLFFWLVPGVFFGFERNAGYLNSWFQSMIVPFTVEGVVTTQHENQSLPGLVHRLLTHSVSFTNYDGARLVSEEYHNVVDWDPAVARALVKALMAAFAVLVIWVCRNPTDQRQRWQLSAEYGLILVGMVLFSERTWKHHCVTLLVPFAVLLYYLASGQPGPRMRRYLVATLAASFLLMSSTTTGVGKPLHGDPTALETLLLGVGRAGKLAQVYGAYLWANVALTAALAVVLRRQQLVARQAVPEPDPVPNQVLHLRAKVWTSEPEPVAEPVEAGERVV